MGFYAQMLAKTGDPTTKYVPVLMIGQPAEFVQVGLELQRRLADCSLMHYAS